MKLHQRAEKRPRSTKSKEVLVQEVEQASDLFDPRVDFPASEMKRLKDLAGNTAERIQQLRAPDNLRDAWWLSLVDSEFKELLYSDPEFKDALLAKFEIYFSHAAGDPRRSIEGVLALAIPMIQLFPELRTILRKRRVDNLLPRLLKKEEPAPSLGDGLLKLRPMLVLYPERREEWLKVYSIQKDDFVTRLSQAMQKLIFRGSEVEMVANALLVFPELRPEILRVAVDKGKWKSAYAKEESPFLMHAFDLGFNLTVIGAESAGVDKQGQIHLELRPTEVHRSVRPLPERSVE